MASETKQLGSLKPGQRFRFAKPLPEDAAAYTVKAVGLLNTQVIPDGFSGWAVQPVLTYRNNEPVVLAE